MTISNKLLEWVCVEDAASSSITKANYACWQESVCHCLAQVARGPTLVQWVCVCGLGTVHGDSPEQEIICSSLVYIPACI
jgi:hypothetical protein